jgi:hypothetical protein
MSTGAFFVVANEREEVMEGSQTELCMTVFFSMVIEREVNVTFDLVPVSTFAGMNINQCYVNLHLNAIYHSTGEMDVVIANESTFIIPPGTGFPSPQFCVTIAATDDLIVEGTELFYFIMRAENPLDKIDQNVTVAVVDNDGK